MASSASSNSMKTQLQNEFLTCAICRGQFINPRVLKCQHSFCYKCLQGCVKANKRSRSSIKCAICRKESTVTKNGVSDFPKNLVLEGLLRMIKEQKRSKAESKIAGEASMTDSAAGKNKEKPINQTHVAKKKASGNVKKTKGSSDINMPKATNDVKMPRTSGVEKPKVSKVLVKKQKASGVLEIPKVSGVNKNSKAQSVAAMEKPIVPTNKTYNNNSRKRKTGEACTVKDQKRQATGRVVLKSFYDQKYPRNKNDNKTIRKGIEFSDDEDEMDKSSFGRIQKWPYAREYTPDSDESSQCDCNCRCCRNGDCKSYFDCCDSSDWESESGSDSYSSDANCASAKGPCGKGCRCYG